MEQIWYKDIKNFINEHTWDRFFPTETMTYTAKLNSILRLSIYFSIVILIIKKDTNVFFIPIIVGLITLFLHHGSARQLRMEEDFLHSQNLHKDKYTKELCHKPTANNPFMNVLMSDYSKNPTRKKACNISHGPIRREAHKHFNKNLYRDVSDIFHKNASDRNYITQPVTTIPNDQDAYLKFMYDIKPTCKEGSGSMCVSNLYRTIQQ